MKFLFVLLVSTIGGLCALNRKHSNIGATMQQQVNISETAKTNPVKAAEMALQIPNIMKKHQKIWTGNNNITGTGDDAQVPWACGARFSWNPPSFGTSFTGYFALPWFFDNFWLNRSTVVEERDGKQAKIPVYVTAKYNPEEIDRVVIVWPGAWRNSWVYINLVGNAYRIAQKYPELNVRDGKVFMMSPVFFNQDDKVALKHDELYFNNEGWSAGGTARHPDGFQHISSFQVMDRLIEIAVDKNRFPNVKKVVVIGHSLGAQANLHYALIKRPKKYDNIIKYWIGDPGAVTYLDDWRPIHKHNCSGYNSWPYGLSNHGSIPKYNRKRAGKHGERFKEQFYQKNIHFGIALNDNGHGNTHCQAMMQGPNRISRTSLWIKHFGDDFPSNFTVDYVPGLSHQDYPMIAYYGSLKYIFTD